MTTAIATADAPALTREMIIEALDRRREAHPEDLDRLRDAVSDLMAGWDALFTDLRPSEVAYMDREATIDIREAAVKCEEIIREAAVQLAYGFVLDCPDAPRAGVAS
jgi:hypothetical protein